MGAIFLFGYVAPSDHFDDELFNAMRDGFNGRWDGKTENCSGGSNYWQCRNENDISKRVFIGNGYYEAYEKPFWVEGKKYTFQVMMVNPYDTVNCGVNSHNTSYLKIFGGEEAGKQVAEFWYVNGHYNTDVNTDQQPEVLRDISQAIVDAVQATVGIRSELEIANSTSADCAIAGVVE